MWIMLINKLPTVVSPPRLSIFWSTAWPHEEWAQSQARRLIAMEEIVAAEPTIQDRRIRRQHLGNSEPLDLSRPEFDRDLYPGPTGVGSEPNWARARAIVYKDEKIRVFQHEFSVLDEERMQLYVVGQNGDGPSHELVPGGAADEQLIEDVLTGVRRRIYEAALMDGATEPQALLVAVGKDVSVESFGIPAIGWYRCKPEYARIFCSEREMEE